MNIKSSIKDIQIIDSIEPTQKIDLDIIHKTFNYEVRSLIHGDTVTGRPVTKIIEGDHHIIKCRSE